MTMPTSLMADGIEKQLRQIYTQLLKRVDAKGYTVHQGIPSPDFAFDEPTSVWIAPISMRKDPSLSGFNMVTYVSDWLIHIIKAESSGTDHDVDYFELFHETGRVANEIIATTTDMGLSDVVDTVEEPNVEFSHVPTGDKTCIAAVFTLSATHRQLIRCD